MVGYSRISIWIGLSVFWTCSSGFAEEVPEIINEDVLWSTGGSPYTISEDVEVLEGATLTIEPGVRVEVSADRSLLIRGQLVARGTAAKQIVFTHAPSVPENGHWGSVVFEDSSVDALVNDIDTFVEGSIIEHCLFEHGSRALHLRGASPYISRSVFRDNWYSDVMNQQGGAAIYLEEESSPIIRDCEFLMNAVEGFCYGGAIYVDWSNPVIQDNLFSGNSAVYGGALTSDGSAGPIVGNIFENNEVTTKGGAISLISSASALLNNEITGNRSRRDGGGVHVCVDCKPHSVPFFMDNTITGNTSEVEGAAGVGAAFLRVFSHNNVFGNVGQEQPFDFGWFHELEWEYPAWIAHGSISRNWWGTTEITAINEAIRDGADERDYGTVAIEPILEEESLEPTPRVTLTTRFLRFETEDEPLPVYLTIYNPWEEGELELVIYLQYGDSAPVPVEIALELPEGRWGDAGYQFWMPENSVYFSTVMAPGHVDLGGPDHGYWHAAIFDPGSGERVGDVSTVRFDIVREGRE